MIEDKNQNHTHILVITDKSVRLRESGLLVEYATEILRCAQDDTTPRCHPEAMTAKGW